MKYYRFIVIIAVVFMNACSNEKVPVQSEPIVVNDTLTYVYITKSDSVQNDLLPKETKSIVSYTYPVFKTGNAILDDSLNRIVTTTLVGQTGKPQLIDSLISGFVADYKEIVKSEPDYMMAWSSENNIVIIYQNRSIISMESNSYEYTGGAHPNGHTENINVSLEKKRCLGLEDLFDSLNLEKFTKLAELKFQAAWEISPGDNLDNAGFWFKHGRFTLNENFLIQKDKISFVFNSYEIAPYAMGPTEIELELSSFKSLLKPEAQTYFE